MEGTTGLLTLILTAIGVVTVILKGVQVLLTNVLVKEGLIRPQRRSGEGEDAWPNGWHSLPETLAGLYAELRRIDGRNDQG